MLEGLKRKLLPRRVRVWGHRGVGGTGIENTLGAFELALDQGADGIELDVRPCRSGELVVVHDPDLLQTAGRPEQVAELTLAELQDVPLPGSDERIITLQQALDLVLGRGAVVNVEIKGNVPDLLGATKRLHAELGQRRRRERGRVLVSSFSRRALATLRELGGCELAWLVERNDPEVGPPKGAAAIHPRSDLVDEESLAAWHKQGLAVNVWTVNDPAEARRLSRLPIDGIITDDIPMVRNALGLG